MKLMRQLNNGPKDTISLSILPNKANEERKKKNKKKRNKLFGACNEPDVLLHSKRIIMHKLVSQETTPWYTHNGHCGNRIEIEYMH